MPDNLASLRVQFQEVCREVFLDEAIVLRDEMTARDVEGWDSFGHINLIIATEQRFKVRFATAEISGLTAEGQNVGSFLRLLASKASRSP